MTSAAHTKSTFQGRLQDAHAQLKNSLVWHIRRGVNTNKAKRLAMRQRVRLQDEQKNESPTGQSSTDFDRDLLRLQASALVDRAFVLHLHAVCS